MNFYLISYSIHFRSLDATNCVFVLGELVQWVMAVDGLVVAVPGSSLGVKFGIISNHCLEA